MSGIFSFFGKPRSHNIAVVDISSASVGAAYATSSGVAPPAVVFRSRVENVSESGAVHGMLRALDTVAREMHTKGAPKLRSLTGRGNVDEVIVMVSAPWQISTLEVKVVEKEKPFVFTEAMLAEVLAESRKRLGTTELIGAMLNGYETPNPVGKRATRAEMVLLSSRLDPEVEPYIKQAVKTFVGTTPIRFISFSSAAHLVLRGLFPYQRDFLAIRVGTDATELAFVKQTHIAGVETAEVGTRIFASAAREEGIGSTASIPGELIDRSKSERLEKRLQETEQSWVSAMRQTLVAIAAEGALPRVIFLFTDERALPFFKRLLDAPELHDLWLSDEPLSVIPVNPRHFYAFMRHLEEGNDDAVLDMLALVSRVS